MGDSTAHPQKLTALWDWQILSNVATECWHDLFVFFLQQVTQHVIVALFYSYALWTPTHIFPTSPVFVESIHLLKCCLSKVIFQLWGLLHTVVALTQIWHYSNNSNLMYYLKNRYTCKHYTCWKLPVVQVLSDSIWFALISQWQPAPSVPCTPRVRQRAPLMLFWNQYVREAGETPRGGTSREREWQEHILCVWSTLHLSSIQTF